MIKSVKFWDRMRAAAYTYQPHEHVISIRDPGDPPVNFQGSPGDVRTLAFYDVVDTVKVRESFTAHPMSKNDAAHIDHIIRQWDKVPEHIDVIVHCVAGASRSAAVALYIHHVTGCEFPTMSFANNANLHVLGELGKAGNTDPMPTYKQMLDLGSLT